MPPKKQIRQTTQHSLILGGGLAGLAAADKLLDAGYKVTILEGAPFLGGLASSTHVENEEIPRFNHHIVRTNTKTLEYLNRYHLMGKNTWKRINLAVAYQGKVRNINKPWKYLAFDYLNLWEKFRFGLFGVYVSYLLNPNSLPDNLDAETYLDRMCGKTVTQKMYYQLYGRNKFNISLKQISAKQLAHRMKEREFNDLFTYPMKGIQGMIDGLEKDVRKKGGQFVFPVRILNVDLKKNKVLVTNKKSNAETFTYDTLINTIPVPEFIKFTTGLPKSYIRNIKKLRYTPVVGLLFATNDFLDAENYWINFIGERIHVLYQHSVLVDKYKSKISWVIRYGGSIEDLPKTNKEIQTLYLSELNRYFPDMNVNWCLVFREKYAEPVYDKNYAAYAPSYSTPIPNLFHAGIQVTFPKIRNMNVALESGEIVAQKIMEKDRLTHEPNTQEE